MTNPDLKLVAERGPVMGLDAKYFTDRDLFRRIVDEVFYRNWLLACHSSQLREPGDYLTLEIYDQDILITRDREGALRAFYNVCQHRGHKLADGSGNRRLLVCPYHAWSYDLKGHLKAAPHANKVPGFDASKICLTEIRLENFLGFLFVNLDPDCRSMDETYPGIREEMLKLCPDVEQRRYACHHTADEGCNWFVAVENYNECYHCSNCHPSFAKGIIDPNSYSIAPYGDIKVLHHTSQASHSDEAWYDVSGADYGSFFLWPATSIQFYPGGLVNSFTWRPLAVDDVRVFRSFYSNDGEVDATLQKVIDNDRETTFQEDLDLVSEIQRGLNSRGYRPGPLVLNPEGGINNEFPIYKLHEWLRAAVD
ncbi:MAG: aromatic ring-hydroxylating dioxygenase subunit alpha [Gammaproteobacteria bacterium]|nr:aromatic ring-hydroxylating dioxygenase subunit alpha [Gammaproteobacteria bacterium]MDH3536639.1 aromatic ring-hydroxylating dioxygenase subunit alpha [Gammaproteobacteria bacterium]